jgi:hypothetical protein
MNNKRKLSMHKAGNKATTIVYFWIIIKTLAMMCKARLMKKPHLVGLLKRAGQVESENQILQARAQLMLMVISHLRYINQIYC